MGFTKENASEYGKLGGRPRKGESWTDVLALELGREEKRKVARAIYNAALKGDVTAAKWLADRMDGAVTQKQIIADERDSTLPEGLSVEELRKLAENPKIVPLRDEQSA